MRPVVKKDTRLIRREIALKSNLKKRKKLKHKLKKKDDSAIR